MAAPANRRARIDPMRRRRTAELIAVTLLVPALAGCPAQPADPTAPAAPDRPTAAADPAASPATNSSADPAAPGAAPESPPPGTAPARSFGVGVRTLRLNRGGDRPLPVTLWYPAEGGSPHRPRDGAEAARGRFPIVLFSHGLTGLPVDYRALLTRWVAAGFVVAAPAYPHTSRGAEEQRVLDVLNQPADASYVLTEVLALDTRSGDPLRGRLATGQVAAAGHSAGGVTTVGLFTTARDERLDAGIVLAGSSLGFGTAFSGRAAPQLFVHGELDKVVAYQAGRAAYEAVPWPKAMLSLPDGDHGRDLLEAGNPALDVVSRTTIEFLRWTLYGDPEARHRLRTVAGRDGLARLDDRL